MFFCSYKYGYFFGISLHFCYISEILHDSTVERKDRAACDFLFYTFVGEKILSSASSFARKREKIWTESQASLG